jgi:hypothetical protein
VNLHVDFWLTKLSVQLADNVYLPCDRGCRVSYELDYSGSPDCKISLSEHNTLGHHPRTSRNLQGLCWYTYRPDRLGGTGGMLPARIYCDVRDLV